MENQNNSSIIESQSYKKVHQMLRNIYIMLLSNKSKENESLRDIALSGQKIEIENILKQIESRTRKLTDTYEK